MYNFTGLFLSLCLAQNNKMLRRACFPRQTIKNQQRFELDTFAFVKCVSFSISLLPMTMEITLSLAHFEFTHNEMHSKEMEQQQNI